MGSLPGVSVRYRFLSVVFVRIPTKECPEMKKRHGTQDNGVTSYDHVLRLRLTTTDERLCGGKRLSKEHESATKPTRHKPPAAADYTRSLICVGDHCCSQAKIMRVHDPNSSTHHQHTCRLKCRSLHFCTSQTSKTTYRKTLRKNSIGNVLVAFSKYHTVSYSRNMLLCLQVYMPCHAMPCHAQTVAPPCLTPRHSPPQSSFKPSSCPFIRPTSHGTKTFHRRFHRGASRRSLSFSLLGIAKLNTGLLGSIAHLLPLWSHGLHHLQPQAHNTLAGKSKGFSIYPFNRCLAPQTIVNLNLSSRDKHHAWS